MISIKLHSFKKGEWKNPFTFLYIKELELYILLWK